MKTKLTLTVKSSTIKKVEFYAKNTGRSLSDLIESYFENLIQDSIGGGKVSEQLMKVVGSVKLPENFDDKKEQLLYLENRYL